MKENTIMAALVARMRPRQSRSMAQMRLAGVPALSQYSRPMSSMLKAQRLKAADMSV